MANKLFHELKRDLQPSRLLPSLSAGLVTGILVIIIEISFASMIFSGDLSIHLSKGIGFTLFGGFLIGMVVALTSNLPGAVGLPQDGPTAIITIIAVAIAGSLAGTVSEEDIFYTIVAAISISSMMTGCFFLIMGKFRLGNLARFIPYPVMGGFLAGIGWLLVKGSIGVMTDISLDLSQVPGLFQPSILIKWLPGLLYAVLLLMVLQRHNHFLITPVMLLAAICLFYLLLSIAGISVSEAEARGWLLGPFPEGSMWQPLTLATWPHVDWWAIFGQIGNMGTILVISVISLLLYASGLEVALRRDIDLNQELKSTGIANVFGGLVGSPAGYLAVSLSALGHKIGADSRLLSIFSAALCGVTLFWGATFISFFPRPVAGALLLYIGLDFLCTWAYEAWFKLPKTDYCLVLLILIVAATLGFLQGVAVGIIVAVLIFIMNYSRINIIKYALSGLTYRSHVERSAPHKWLLDKKGGQIHILKLQGFIFFGTANSLLEKILQRIDDPLKLPLTYLILDFNQVTGLDSSAINSFKRMKQLAHTKNFTIGFTKVSKHLHRQMEKNDLFKDTEDILRIFPDLDHGVEWCENQILSTEEAMLQTPSGDTSSTDKAVIFESTFDDIMTFFEKQEIFEALIETLMPYFESNEWDAGDYVIQRGGAVDGLYFIISGQVTSWIEGESTKMIRLQTIGTGGIIGNLGFDTETSMNTSVVVNEPSRIFFLSSNRLKQIEKDDPITAAKLHKYLAYMLGDQLTNITRTVRAIMES